MFNPVNTSNQEITNCIRTDLVIKKTFQHKRELNVFLGYMTVYYATHIIL